MSELCVKPRAHAISAQEFGESGQHRIPPKCVTPRNQESGIKWSIKKRKREKRIGRGEQNQELALATLENRKGSGGNENGESRS